MSLTRRTVLAGLIAAPAILRAQPRRDERLPISFSTLGCPKWPWKRVLEQASAMG